MSRIRAVILDIDGTLLDSNAAHARAYVDVGEELGYTFDFETVRRLIGMGGDKLLPRAIGIEEDSEEGERITTRKKEIFRQRYLPALEPTPGVRALLQRLRADGIELVVATSADGDEVAGLLRQAGIEDLIEDATSSSDAAESKPDPDIVAAALEKAGVPPEQAVMIGDTPYDVEAAARAGVPIIAVRTGGWRDADLAGAIAVYDSPAELLRRYEDSYFGRGG